MKTHTHFQKIQHIKKLSAFINFAIELLGDEILPGTRFKMAQFKVGYQSIKLNDYNSEQAIDKLISIGDKLIKNYE